MGFLGVGLFIYWFWFLGLCIGGVVICVVLLVGCILLIWVVKLFGVVWYWCLVGGFFGIFLSYLFCFVVWGFLFLFDNVGYW
jgi:hypothetical protein